MPRKTGGHAQIGLQPIAASMRPRPDAAENSQATVRRWPVAYCFNEAAARCRGKHEVLRKWRNSIPALQ